MFELAGAKLSDFDSGDQRENDIRREALFQMGFDAEGVCCVDENASVLGRNDGLDDRGEVIDVW